MKSKYVVSGTVERVGFFGYIGDVHFMTVLIVGRNEIFQVSFDGNNPANSAASLTQSGDNVEFEVSEHCVRSKNFVNKTVAARLQEETDVGTP